MINHNNAGPAAAYVFEGELAAHQAVAGDACGRGTNCRCFAVKKINRRGVTQMGCLIRADSTCRLNQDGIEALKAYGIRTVIDLRAPHEIEKRS